MLSTLGVLLTSCGTQSPPQEAPASTSTDSVPAVSKFEIKRSQTLDANTSITGLGWIGVEDRAKLVVLGKDGTLLVWDLSDEPRIEREVRLSSRVSATILATGRQTQQLAIGHSNGSIDIRDLSKGDDFLSINVTPSDAPRPVLLSQLAFSADEKSVVATGSTYDLEHREDPPMIFFCDIAAGKVAFSAELEGTMFEFGTEALSTDGRRLINSSTFYGLHVRLLPPPTAPHELPVSRPTEVFPISWPGAVSVTALSHNQLIAATGLRMDSGKRARIWFHNTTSGKSLSGVELSSSEAVTKLVFSPNDRYVAVGKESEAKGEIVDVQQLRTVAELDGPASELAWSPDGCSLAAAEGDKITIWKVKE